MPRTVSFPPVLGLAGVPALIGQPPTTWAAIDRGIHALPPFWFAFAVALGQPQAILALPIAVAALGPVAGAGLVLGVGLVGLVLVRGRVNSWLRGRLREGRPMPEQFRFRSWVVDDYNWSRLALPCAIVALGSLPVFLTSSNRPLILLYTLLPVYMVHQYKEHAHGRFVAHFNATIGKGQAVLTSASAFWINVLAVWLVFIVSFYLARYWEIGIAFVPIYITVVNGLLHAIQGIAQRRYNPGLSTSLLLFLPWGVFLWNYFRGIVERDVVFNAVGLAAAIVGHALIMVYAVRRRTTLQGGPQAGAHASR